MAHVNTFTSTKAFYGQVYNLQPVGENALQTMNLYVNSVTGIDGGPGRGTSASAPYKNLEQALKDAFALSTKFQVIINLAGALPHGLDDGYVFPLTSSADQITTDTTPSFGFTQQAPLVIRADPFAMITLIDVQIVSQADNAISGLKEITTNVGFTPGVYDGKWLRDANGVLARIINNTVSVFNVCYAGPDLVPPFVMETAGATISPAVPASSNPTVVLRGGSAPVVFFGVDITASAGGALQVGPNQQAIFVACDIPSMELGCGADTQICGDAAIEAFACKLGSMAAPQAEVNLQNSLMTGGTFTDLSAKTSVFAAACSFVSMVSPLFHDGANSVGLFQGTNLSVRLAGGHGVQMSGGKLILTTCDIRKSTGSGVVCTEGCTAFLTACDSGFDNGIAGVVSDTASRVLVADDGTFVRGDADHDLDVGGLPFQSYADFILGSQPNTRFSAAQSSAIYFAAGGTMQGAVITLTAGPYFVTPSDDLILVDTSLGDVTVQLPPIASCLGRRYVIKKIDAPDNTVNITAFIPETIDGAASQPLNVQYQKMTIMAGAVEWSII